MKYIFPLFVIIFLSSCASIPLSTMLKFSTYQMSDFVALQPEVIKAKLVVDEPVRVDIEKVDLTLEIEVQQQSRIYKFPLLLIEQHSIPAQESWLSADDAKTEYTFKLSAESVANFREVQRSLMNSQGGKFNLSVNSGFATLPAEVQFIKLSIFLKLKQDEDYIAIFEDVSIEVKRDG